MLASIWCVLGGGVAFIATSGQVVGSEFGIQIMIANELAKMIVWLGMFGLWAILRSAARPASRD